MNHCFKWLASAVALSLPSWAAAQQPAESRQPLRYQSAFADYKPWQDIKPGDWRQMNAAVAPSAGKGAGHEGQGAAAPTKDASAPAREHQGHQHGGKR